MKNTTLFIVLIIGFCFNSIGQTASKNLENCQYVISLKPEGEISIIKSTFQIITLNDIQRNELVNIIYAKSHTTYNVEIVNNNFLKIYHLSDVSIEYLKELLVSYNYYIRFIENVTLGNLPE